MQKMKGVRMLMNSTFMKMVNRLMQSASELENMTELDIKDEYIKLELSLKFHEINRIVSMLENVLNKEEPKEDDSLQQLLKE